jgi:DNA-directed RNA polymerase subunit RPC12/RpoP
MDSDAIFRCMTCGSTRPYGNDRPDDKAATPMIGCTACGKATRHEYAVLVDHQPVSGLRTFDKGMVAQ